MADEKGRKSDSRILESLYEFLEGVPEDVGSLPIDRVLKDLKKAGIDTAPLLSLVRDRLAAARAVEILASAREERARIDELARGRSVTEGSSLRERARSGLEALSSKRPELAAAYWRKFDSASDADLESVLEDLALLDQLKNEDGDDR